MTILGRVFPEESPWVSMWGWNQEWSPRRMTGPWFDRWRESLTHSSTSSSGERQIPIQFVDGHSYQEPLYSGYWEEWSDSDCEDCDMNTNSGERPRRKRRYGQTPASLTTSKDTSLSADLIDLEKDNPVTRRKIPFRESESENLTRSTRYRTRTSENKLDKPNYIQCDSDIENDINDTCNYSVYEYLKAFLNSTGRQIDSIRGDGNCFFRALSKVIYGNQTFYNDIRQAVVDVLEKHPKKFEAFADGPMSEHIKDMREDKTWATQTEIYAAATLLNRDIYILSPDQTGETYRWLLFKPQLKYNTSVTGCQCYITICHTHGNHYDRIAAHKGKCNCDLEPPEMCGVKESVDLTNEDEIV